MTISAEYDIVVASNNPVKIASTREGFYAMFPEQEFVITNVIVPPKVRAQPMSDEETLQGAYNRACGAVERKPYADYWVGIEGGIEPKEDGMEAFAWVVVMTKYLTGKGKSGTFLLPPQIIELVNQGYELGEADDMVFRLKNSKQDGGAIGRLTHGVISRTKLYTQAVELALIPFVNLELYSSDRQDHKR